MTGSTIGLTTGDVYVAGTGSETPPSHLVTDSPVPDTDIVAVAQADRAPSSPSGADLAATAAAAALRAAGTDPLALDRFFYASSFEPTAPLWPPASYVAAQLGVEAPAVRVDQVSNGGMAAFQLGTDLVRAGVARAVLVATGDRHTSPSINRWTSDPGTVYGDGGTGLVLTNSPGRLRVLSAHTCSDPSLEGMHRPGPDEPASGHTDLGAHKRRFLREQGAVSVAHRIQGGQRSAVERALKDTAVSAGDVAWFVVPYLGLRRLRTQILNPLDIPLARTTWEWGRTVGHLGPGDQIHGLHHLLISGRLCPGEKIMVLGIGSGFSWSCAVVEACP